MREEKNNDYQRVMAVAKGRGLLDSRLIQFANDFAVMAHQGKTRLSGKPFITHPWAVARIIADMELESDLIAAALLHDVLEHGANADQLKEAFESPVADVVLNLTIDKTNEDPNSYHIAYNEKLADMMEEDFAPLYIKLACRIHNLKTLKYCDEEARTRKIKETEETYLPLVENAGLGYMKQMLQDACFQAKFPGEYQKVEKQYNQLLHVNAKCTARVKELFTKRLLSSKEFSEQLYDCRVRKQKIYDIYESVKLKLRKSDNDYERSITKYHVPLYDIFLIMKDQESEVLLKQFLRMYNEILVSESIIIKNIEPLKDVSCIQMILEDRFFNQYRLHIYGQSKFEMYLYGQNPKRNRYLPAKSRAEGDKNVSPKIRVYTKDNEEKRIIKGASVLDFAFLIHENIGLCAQYAFVNNEKVSLDTILRENDRIEIVVAGNNAEFRVCAQFQWFEFVKTPRAIHCLVRWFEKNYVIKMQ